MEQHCWPCAPSTTRGRATLFDGRDNKLVFASGRNIAIVDVSTLHTQLFTEHAQRTTTVRLSPDGTRAASADASGAVKVWTLADRACSNTVPALAGAVRDLAWSADGSKIACVGEGRGRLARCFAADGQNSLGDFEGLSSTTNSVAFTAVDAKLGVLVGSDDGAVKLYAGVPGPFSFLRSALDADSKAFINCVRVCPTNTQLFAVASAQLKLHHLDGGSPATLAGHTGSILSVSFAPAGDHVASAGADKTVRLFDVQSTSQTHCFTLGAEVSDMQCGVLYLDDSTLASVSLSGDVNLFDTRTKACRQTIKSHQKSVTALCCRGSDVMTADYEGAAVLTRRVDAPASVAGIRSGHTNAIIGMHASASGAVVSAGLDDTLRSTLGSDVIKMQLPGAPSSLDVSLAELCVLVTTKGVCLAHKDKVVYTLPNLPSAATTACITADGTQVAVGCEDGSLRLYAVQAGSSLELTAPLPAKHRGAVTCMRFSPAGNMLATADADRAVYIWDVEKRETKATGGRFHNSRVTALAWQSNGSRLASGGLDCTIFVWLPDEPAGKRVTINHAHRDGVSALGWVGEVLVSAGADSCVRTWRV